MNLRKHLWILFFISLAVFVVCSQPPEISPENIDQANYVVAKGDSNYVLTINDLYDKMCSTRVALFGGKVLEDSVDQIRDSIVSDTMAGLMADLIDLKDYYYDYWTYRLRYHDLLVSTFVSENILNKISVDSQEIHDFYYDNPDIFHMDEQVNMYHIFISPRTFLTGEDSLYYKSLSEEEFNLKVKEYVYNIYKMLDYGEPFENVALEYSQDKVSQRTSGYAGWTKRGIYKNPFDSVAFSLKPGEYSKPYQDSDGWHIVYIDDYIPEGLPSLDRPDIYSSAEASLIQLKANELAAKIYDTLYNEIHYVTNPTVMDTNIYQVDDTVWVAVLNGRDTIDAKYLKNKEHTFRKRYRVRNTTPALKDSMIYEVCQRLITVESARKQGLDTLPFIAKERGYLMHKSSKSVVIRGRYDLDWQPSDSAVRAYYDAHINNFIFDKNYHIEYILTEDSIFAEFMRDQIASGIPMKDLYESDLVQGSGVQVSYEDMGFIKQDEVDSVFYEWVLRTPLKYISKPFPWQGGYCIINIVEKNDNVEFHQARGNIIEILRNRKKAEDIAQYNQNLFDTFHVTFPTRIKSMQLPPYADRIKN